MARLFEQFRRPDRLPVNLPSTPTGGAHAQNIIG